MQEQRTVRHKRMRIKVRGTKECPRLSVFRSNRNVCVQLIDDIAGVTLASVSSLGRGAATKKSLKDKGVKKKGEVAVSRTEEAFAIGEAIAKKALEKKITKVVFDRGGYQYHGIIRAVAEGARKGGLNF